MEITKVCSLVLTLICLVTGARGQFYYKDQIVLQQTRDQLKQYRAEKVKAVKLRSFESDGKISENFVGEQAVNNNYTQLVTNTKTTLSDSSELISFFDNRGNIVKSVDTSDGFSSITQYAYDASNKLFSITNTSTSAGQVKETENHLWFYDASGKPAKMLKIKNSTDTTFVEFTIDDRGNVSEEKSFRNKKPLATYYYYYDDHNRLTDIVRYNERARRLLPDYIFEYDEDGRLSTMLVVPEGSSDYQKWYYSYYDNGLKGQEAAYNKKQELLGKVEYHYTFLN